MKWFQFCSCSFFRIFCLLNKLVLFQCNYMVAVKQADRQASRILKMRSSKPKNFRIPRILSCSWRAGGRASRITGPLFPDYIPQRMRGMAMDSGLLRPVPTRCLKIDAVLFLWCIGIHYAL